MWLLCINGLHSLNLYVRVWLLTLIRLTHEPLELFLGIRVRLGLEDAVSCYTCSYHTTPSLRSLTSLSIFNELCKSLFLACFRMGKTKKGGVGEEAGVWHLLPLSVRELRRMPEFPLLMYASITFTMPIHWTEDTQICPISLLVPRFWMFSAQTAWRIVPRPSKPKSLLFFLSVPSLAQHLSSSPPAHLDHLSAAQERMRTSA